MSNYRYNTNIDLGLALLCTKELFEIYGPGPKGNQEIAALIEEWTGSPVSRERIRQMIDRPLRKLRHSLEHDPALREAVEHYVKRI